MNRLLDIGFEPVGHWLIQNEKLTFELIRNATENNVLYAFVCDEQVKYIGKSKRTLKERMIGYKNPGKDQSTNIRNHQRIKDSIAEGSAVEIFALADRGLIHYGVFHLNLAAALEDDIIKVLDPEWNGGSGESTSNFPTSALAISEPMTLLSMSQDTTESKNHKFVFVLQPTYNKMGFFNVSVNSQKFIGADSEKIELFLGDSMSSTLGTINRTANTNGTPRVMGGTKLRDWFNNNAKVMSSIEITVLSPTSIRIKNTD